METEIETGFVALLEAYNKFEWALTGKTNPKEIREVELEISARINALYEMAEVDSDLPGPKETDSPLINWLWNRAANSTSTG